MFLSSVGGSLYLTDEEYEKRMNKLIISRAVSFSMVSNEYHKELAAKLNVDKLIEKTLMRIAVNRALNKLNAGPNNKSK